MNVYDRNLKTAARIDDGSSAFDTYGHHRLYLLRGDGAAVHFV